MHIRISLGTKFHFKETIMNFETKFAQKLDFRSKNGNNEYHHRILHIRISLDTKCQLKQS